MSIERLDFAYLLGGHFHVPLDADNTYTMQAPKYSSSYKDVEAPDSNRLWDKTCVYVIYI